MARTRQKIHGQALEFWNDTAEYRGTIQQIGEILVLKGSLDVQIGDLSNATKLIFANPGSSIQFSGSLPFHDAVTSKDLITLGSGVVTFKNQNAAGTDPVLFSSAADQRLALTGKFAASDDIITAQKIILNSGTAFEATLQHSNDAARAYTLPNKSGIITIGTGVAGRLAKWLDGDEVQESAITVTAGALGSVTTINMSGDILGAGDVGSSGDPLDNLYVTNLFAASITKGMVSILDEIGISGNFVGSSVSSVCFYNGLIGIKVVKNLAFVSATISLYASYNNVLWDEIMRVDLDNEVLAFRDALTFPEKHGIYDQDTMDVLVYYQIRITNWGGGAGAAMDASILKG